MPPGFKRNIDDLVHDVNQQSDKALYPYLKLHIFGPYQDDCYAYLTELKTRLQEKGFFQASICDDRGNSPPKDATREELWEFWWSESEKFLSEADVAVFLFLDHIFERESLPRRARNMLDCSGDTENGDDGLDDSAPKEINTSVVGEMFYWLMREDKRRERSLLIFEDGIYEELGSVVTGATQATGVDYEVIPNESIDDAVDEIRQRATNWVMDICRSDLVERYTREQLS